MQQEELEEKVTIMEELIQGFEERMNVIETGMAEFLKTFLEQYRDMLNTIAARIETANKRYDHDKIQQNIDDVTKLVSTMPKVIGVKTSHHFGKWSKSLIIGLLVCFVITATSVGTALYLNQRDDKLNNEAYNFWLVRALYPKTAEAIITKLKEDPDGFTAKAEKEMAKQNAIIAAKAQADQADKEQKVAKDNLEKLKSGK